MADLIYNWGKFTGGYVRIIICKNCGKKERVTHAGRWLCDNCRQQRELLKNNG